MKTEPRIYVACLASYNNGVLHGEWIDATDADTMRDEIAAILRESEYPNVKVDCPDCDGEGHDGLGNLEPDGSSARNDTCETCKGTGKVPSAEEYAVHDYEGFGSINLGEHPDLDELASLAAAIEEHGEPFLAWAANDSSNRDVESFQEQYMGEHDSLADYVEQFWEDCGFKAEPWPHPTNYINWESLARDWELGGDVWTHEANGKVYIFNNH